VFTLKTKPIADPKPGEYTLTNELIGDIAAIIGDDSLKTVDDAITNEKLNKYLQDGLNKANARAASNAQKVQKFFVVKRDFTIESGELTPTMKLKRRIVVQQYAEDIEKLYKVDE